MARTGLKTRLLFVAALLFISGGLPSSVDAVPACPSDGIVRTTSGSTAYGATCDDALSNLSAEEWPKMNCPYGISKYTFVYNNCTWTGSGYEVTGWYRYECQTNCHSKDLE